MWKVSFTPLLFGFILAFACVAGPQMSRAGDDAKPAATGGKPTPLAARKAHRVFKHAQAKRFTPATSRAAVTGQSLVHTIAPTQVAAAPVSPDGPPMAALPAEQHDVSVGGARERPGVDRAQPLHEAVEPRHAAPSPGKRKSAEIVAVPREVRQFCSNTAVAAVDARVAWQAEQLTDLADKLKLQIAALEAKRSEYEDWLRKHDEAMKQAKEDIVAIYSRMRPDAAAAQLGAMDEVMAASLLAKLNARVASAILAEMDPARAARITNAMVGPVSAASGKKS